MREALVELVLLAMTGGVLGAWIVLRRLAFFSHAAGTATFPGLVVGRRLRLQRRCSRASRWRSAYAGGVSAPAARRA